MSIRSLYQKEISLPSNFQAKHKPHRDFVLLPIEADRARGFPHGMLNSSGFVETYEEIYLGDFHEKI